MGYTNPTLQDVIDDFNDLGVLPLEIFDGVPLRTLVSRIVVLSQSLTTQEEQNEWSGIHTELAKRLMGREPLFL